MKLLYILTKYPREVKLICEVVSIILLRYLKLVKSELSLTKKYKLISSSSKRDNISEQIIGYL
jgi:hypothetical protein